MVDRWAIAVAEKLGVRMVMQELNLLPTLTVAENLFLDDMPRRMGWIDRKRLFATGGSYGGYMCYAAAVQYKDKLRATNCIVAISNFVTILRLFHAMSA